MHKFDWNDLRYFLAVSRAGSLAGAARNLGVRHTTVGRRIEALEAALSASLFTRTPEGFALTEAGSAITPLAEEAERAADAVERRVAGEDERIDGLVRVTTSEAFTGFLVRRLTEPNRDRVRQVAVTKRGLAWIHEHCGSGAIDDLNLNWADAPLVDRHS